MDWNYFPSEALTPAQRRRKPIGRQPVPTDGIGQLLVELVRSSLTTDVLLTIATTQLAWFTDGQVTAAEWSGVKLSNGGAYLVPLWPTSVRAHRQDSYFDETLSADGAGLCATMFLVQEVQNREVWMSKDLRTTWKQLYCFLDQHPECCAIRAVLD